MSESREHSEEELRKIAPTLVAIPKDRFNVPEGYFSQLESSLINKFQEGSSELEVPEDFFEKMHSEILTKVDRDKEATKVVSMNRSRTAVWISTAISVAAVGILMIWMFSAQQEKCATFACLLEETELTQEDLMILDEADLYELIENEEDLLDASELNEEELLIYLEEDLDEITIDELYE